MSSNGSLDERVDICFLEILNCFFKNSWLFFESGCGLRYDIRSECSLSKVDFLPIPIITKSFFGFLPATLIAWDICVVQANLSSMSVSIFFESNVLFFFA